MSDVSLLEMSREEICSLLSHCDSSSLISVMNSLLQEGRIGTVDLVRPAVTGTVQLQVREPICEERFIVGDALVSVAEVSIEGTLGWAMRLDADEKATVAAAIADAYIARGGLKDAERLAELIRQTKFDLDAADAREWSEISNTVIEFEELD
jgi:phosphonate C-P lyase system protein PhnG